MILRCGFSMSNISTLERFWRRVDKSSTYNGCWHWTASKNRKGYGTFRVDGKSVLPHRFIYIVTYGATAPGLDVKHICRNRACVNPEHLTASHKGPPKGLTPWNKGKGHPAEERFWRFVHKPLDLNDCWTWTGYISKDGYGSFTPSKIPIRAHRFMYQLTHGVIPPGMLICHTCDNPICVNDAHLFLGSNSDNMKDAASKGRLDGKKGSDNPLAKLAEKQVLKIRSLKGTLTTRQIAKIFDISHSHVLNIQNRKAWTHI